MKIGKKLNQRLEVLSKLYHKMDLIDLMKFLGVAISTFIVYRLMVHERKDKTKGHYTRPGEDYLK